MNQPRTPKMRHATSELYRFAVEFAQLRSAAPLLRRQPRGDGHPVMTLPGFGGADGSMALVRKWTRHWGYDARPWELGRNIPMGSVKSIEDTIAFRDDMIAQATARVETIHRETGRKVSLIGWSMGGIYANVIAQQNPDKVRQVITLGTPYGDPRGTVVFGIMQRLNRNPPDSITTESLKPWIDIHRDEPRNVPTTVIYSKSDGIVHPDIATLDDRDPNVNHVKVRSSHVGFTFNARVLWVIAKHLAGDEQQTLSPYAGLALQG